MFAFLISENMYYYRYRFRSVCFLFFPKKIFSDFDSGDMNYVRAKFLDPRTTQVSPRRAAGVLVLLLHEASDRVDGSYAPRVETKFQYSNYIQEIVLNPELINNECETYMTTTHVIIMLIFPPPLSQWIRIFFRNMASHFPPFSFPSRHPGIARVEPIVIPPVPK